MNELICAMSKDMGISRYKGESIDSFIYRVCYSAMGLWCLWIAQSSSNNMVGATKKHQTVVINELMKRYIELFPSIASKFSNDKKTNISFSVHIRSVYEETGYLFLNANNRNELSNFGRTICIGNTSLFFGIPTNNFILNGLGVFTSPTRYTVTISEFLLRDSLSYEEYLLSMYETTDFYEKDDLNDDLQFFNPLSDANPSQSWSAQIFTDFTVARKSEQGPYYRVIRGDDKSLLFADETIERHGHSLTAYEYRRLYFALKAHYDNPLVAKIVKIDDEYSILRLTGYLPNREYYFLLLISWPINNAFNKVHFLIKNDFIAEITSTLNNIGIEVRGEDVK
ncbi:hypothetical protein RW092_21855 [Paenibacillus sp. 3LSP]|uniref:hypothetical protein n=1 Tax=Paenibacillus TaxID=44249 RepID=UPI0004921B4F|nr:MULTISPECIES: hypothetical protein [Paenibacillus]MDU0332818.1 hypothetical protein [Paenibacillus sp. 3LSP]SMF00668.1 hypothetical protein SAMN02744102_00891 [Paenibacillus barengoltzii]